MAIVKQKKVRIDNSYVGYCIDAIAYITRRTDTPGTHVGLKMKRMSQCNTYLPLYVRWKCVYDALAMRCVMSPNSVVMINSGTGTHAEELTV